MKLAWALLLTFIALHLPAQELSVSAYRERLHQVDAALHAGARDQAAALAGELLTATVRVGGEAIAADVSVLRPIAARRNASVQPLAQLVREWAATAGGEAIAVDRALLGRLQREQAEADLRRGGEIVSGSMLPEKARGPAARAWAWAVDHLRRLMRWLFELWFQDRGDGKHGGVVAPVLIMVACIAVVAIALALATRRVRPAPATAGTADAGPPTAADHDPLSRGAGEWERHAAALTAAGRHREAIRAWFHALLVGSCQTGLLHYRRGRTNWEYAWSLPADLAWRSTFHALTRSFDREWYGRAESTREALDDFAQGAQSILGALRTQAAA